MILLDTYRELKQKHQLMKICEKADKLKYINNGSDKTNYFVYRPDNYAEGLMSIVCGVMGYLEYCKKNNLILVVDMQSSKNSYISDSNVGKENAWEYFFQQPMNIKESLNDILSSSYYTLPERTVHGLYYDKYIAERIDLRKYIEKIHFPEQKDFLDNKSKLQNDCNLYKQYFCLSESARKYIDAEEKSVLPKGCKVLGVVCRGTDYVQLKPYNHNIQPTPNEILEKVKDFLIENREYKYVYIATETEQAVELFKRELKPLGVEVLVNKRMYFDQFDFSKQFLSDVKIKRDNDEYLRGIEYLSSIYLVSKCDSLIAGLCGGSQMAIIINNLKYNYVYLFDLGVYG